MTTINLTMLTNDNQLAALARAYWARSDDGRWVHDVRELAAKFKVPQGRMHQIVTEICTATSPSIVCRSCHERRTIGSRAIFTSLVKASRSGSQSHHQVLTCDECGKAEAATRRAHAAAAERAKKEAILEWLANKTRDREVISYRRAPLLDAFLIDGLLRYAGDAWRGDQLDAWEEYQPRLCPLQVDSLDVYVELYARGWILPTANSPLDAFTIDDAGAVRINVARVNWVLTDDSEGLPHGSIIDVMDSILKQSSTAEYADVWYWVSMRELRDQFQYVHDRFQFKSKGWTDAVQQNLKLLLKECSLPLAKKIVWTSISGLAARLKDREYATAHVYNMIPGGFARTFERYRSNGWEMKMLPRVSHTKEAIYTSHLFDRVLGGGTQLYETLTGSYFETGGTS